MRGQALSSTIEMFLQDCRDRVKVCPSPADCVEALAPVMSRLLNYHQNFLKPDYLRSNPDHYERNAIFIDEDNRLSLFAIIWLPGQWTPIHDHGTWGLVGVVEGMLEERNFIRVDRQASQANEGIELVRGGVTMLSPGSVTSFVPNPDHIHITGNAHPQRRVVSLHLYGNAMAGFNTYDLETKTRRWVEVSCNR